MHITTNRLILRYFDIFDANDVYEYSKNPNVSQPACWISHPNLEYSKKIVEKFIIKKEIAIYHKMDKKVIGSIGIFEPVNPNLKGMEISYSLSELYWHKGIMQEALNYALPYIFKYYKISSIYCCSLADNYKSIHTIEAMGFSYLFDYLYDYVPNSEAKIVKYYELKYENFYYFKNTFSIKSYKEFRSINNWVELSPIQYQQIKNTKIKIAIYNKNKLIGIARCISDFSYLFLICDVMVLKDYQGMGIGKKMLKHLIKYIKYNYKGYKKIYIMSLKGKEGFYEKLGFSKDICTGLTIESEDD